MNENLKNYLIQSISEKKLSHAFLVESNNIEATKNGIFEIFRNLKTINSQSNIESNLSIFNVYPENNNIDKSKILELQKFIITTSFDNNYKIYFINNAECMSEVSQNKLLKVLEEPSNNVVGFLLTSNNNSLLSTIKSRCEIFYDNSYEIDNENYKDILLKLNELKNVSSKDLIKLKQELLKYDRINIVNILIQYLTNIENHINYSKEYLLISDIIEKLKLNVNIELCIDKLFIEMRK